MVYIRDTETGELIEALHLAVILEALVARVQPFILCFCSTLLRTGPLTVNSFCQGL